MDKRYEKLLKCRDYVRSVTDFVPKAALVLGSGLGGFAEALDVVCEVPYSDIPGFPVSTVPGHAGKFIFGYLDGAPVVCMQGRIHYYEGYELSDVVLPARLMHLLGAELLFLTNASGGVNPKFDAGDFMLITDHIMLFFPNPLVGANIEELGTRFPDMSHVYDPELCDIIRGVAKDAGIEMQEGVYCQLTGPCFETPAEVRMLGVLGADAGGHVHGGGSRRGAALRHARVRHQLRVQQGRGAFSDAADPRGSPGRRRRRRSPVQAPCEGEHRQDVQVTQGLVVGWRNSPFCFWLSLHCAAYSTPFLWSCPKKRGGAPKKNAFGVVTPP